MSGVVKLAAVAVSAALCCTVLRKQTPELALVLGLTAGALLLWMLIAPLEYITAFLKELAETAGFSTAVFTPILKVMGIAMVTKTAGELCRDAHESGLAACLELAGTVSALVVTIPLAKAVLSTISELT